MATHPNRSSKSPSAHRNPKPTEVVALREKLAKAKGFNITEAQEKCAELVHTSLRSWQQWESSERDAGNHRRMHPAFWDLAKRRVDEELETEEKV